HITIRQPERHPMAASELPDAPAGTTLPVNHTINLLPRREKIEDWPRWIPQLDRFDPAIAGVAPVVDSRVFISRGAKRKWVTMYGVLPEHYNRIVDIETHLVTGRFIGLNAGEVTLGWKLADDFGIRPGDKVRLRTEEGQAGNYTVAGIFDTGVI